MLWSWICIPSWGWGEIWTLLFFLYSFFNLLSMWAHFTDLPCVAEATCCFMISNCSLILVPYKQLSWPVCLLVFLISLVNIIRRDFCSDAASWLEEDTKVLSNLWCDCHVLQQGNGFGRNSQICASIKPCWGDEYQWGSNGQPFSAGSLLKDKD